MIKITKKTSKNLESEYSLFISFSYDADILAKVKSLPTRRYDVDTKSWEIPEYDIAKVIATLKEFELNIDSNVDMEATKPLTEYEKQIEQSMKEGKLWVVFSSELEFIKTQELKDFSIDLLNKVPKYFYEVPASSSGKYHPKYALGEGGLVRHTKSAMKIANEILNNDTMCGNFTDLEKDSILVALLFHDCLKHGWEDEAMGHTVFDHPIKAGEWIEGMYQAGNTLEIETEALDNIIGCIETHMGQWNKPYGNSGEAELPLPKNKLQKITHLCDYLASRKFLEVIF